MKNLALTVEEVDSWCARIEDVLDRSRTFTPGERETLVAAQSVLAVLLGDVNAVVCFPLLERTRPKKKTKKKGKR